MSIEINATPPTNAAEDLRLEGVTVSVGFDDMLDVSLGLNHPHFDTMIVVTSHDDKRTHQVAQKHGALCVQTDLFNKNGRHFNKGAAINAGFEYFQYYGWRMHIDADIIVPDNFRRMLFNYHALDKNSIYGADRIDLIGRRELDGLLNSQHAEPQHQHRMIVKPQMERMVGGRFVHTLFGYLPLGYFQLWHATCQKHYPYSLGTAAHDDTMFSALWPQNKRQILPGVFVFHLCATTPQWSENWDGQRKHPRLEGPTQHHKHGKKGK